MNAAKASAEQFFQIHVQPTVTQWESSPADIRLAMHAAVSLNQLTDYFWHDFSDSAPHRVFNTASIKQFRLELSSRFPNFALIRDIAESHKHVKLDRSNRVLTSAEQTSVGTLGYGEAKYGAGTYGGAPEIIIELDSGNRTHFSYVVFNVLQMWKTLLAITASN